MEDIELYEAWCEYNNNNLPISFTEFVYEQGRADKEKELLERIKELENRVSELESACSALINGYA